VVLPVVLAAAALLEWHVRWRRARIA